MPLPALVREPEPERLPLKVPAEELVMVIAPRSAMFAVELTAPPVSVSAPTVPQFWPLNVPSVIAPAPALTVISARP